MAFAARNPVVDAGAPIVGTGVPGMLTRAQVAARLGISLAEVKRRERVGLISPTTVNEKGWHLYAPDRLEEIRNCTKGSNGRRRLGPDETVAFSADEAAQVFAELHNGTSLRDCVIKFGIHPVVVQAIAAAWARLDKSLFVSASVMSEINELPLDGVFPIETDAELLEVMRSAAKEVCSRCSRRPRKYCAACVEPVMVARRKQEGL